MFSESTLAQDLVFLFVANFLQSLCLYYTLQLCSVQFGNIFTPRYCYWYVQLKESLCISITIKGSMSCLCRDGTNTPIVHVYRKAFLTHKPCTLSNSGHLAIPFQYFPTKRFPPNTSNTSLNLLLGLDKLCFFKQHFLKLPEVVIVVLSTVITTKYDSALMES